MAIGLTFTFSPDAMAGACKDEGIQQVYREGGKELAGINSYAKAEFFRPGRSAVRMASKKAELAANMEVCKWLSSLENVTSSESGAGTEVSSESNCTLSGVRMISQCVDSEAGFVVVGVAYELIPGSGQ